MAEWPRQWTKKNPNHHTGVPAQLERAETGTFCGRETPLWARYGRRKHRTIVEIMVTRKYGVWGCRYGSRIKVPTVREELSSSSRV